jgi:hypothetical protein
MSRQPSAGAGARISQAKTESTDFEKEGARMTRRDWSRVKQPRPTEDFRHHPRFMLPLLRPRQRPCPPCGPSKAELRALAERASLFESGFLGPRTRYL